MTAIDFFNWNLPHTTQDPNPGNLNEQPKTPTTGIPLLFCTFNTARGQNSSFRDTFYQDVTFQKAHLRPQRKRTFWQRPCGTFPQNAEIRITRGNAAKPSTCSPTIGGIPARFGQHNCLISTVIADYTRAENTQVSHRAQSCRVLRTTQNKAPRGLRTSQHGGPFRNILPLVTLWWHQKASRQLRLGPL